MPIIRPILNGDNSNSPKALHKKLVLIDTVRRVHVDVLIQNIKQNRCGEIVLDEEMLDSLRRYGLRYSHVVRAISDGCALGLFVYYARNCLLCLRLADTDTERERAA